MAAMASSWFLSLCSSSSSFWASALLEARKSRNRMKALRRSFSEEQAGIGGDGDLDLSRQASDIHGLQIGWSAWEPSIIAEEQQPRCKGEAVLSAFGHHHAVIAGGQRLWGCFTPALIDHDAITS